MSMGPFNSVNTSVMLICPKIINKSNDSSFNQYSNRIFFMLIKLILKLIWENTSNNKKNNFGS